MVAPVVAAGASMAGRAATLQAGKLGAKKLASNAGKRFVMKRGTNAMVSGGATQARSIASQNASNAGWKNSIRPMIQNLAQNQQVELSDEELARIEATYGDDLVAREQAIQLAENEKEREAKKMQLAGALIQALKQTKLGSLVNNKDPGLGRQVLETVFGPASMVEWPDGVTFWTWSTVSYIYEGIGFSKLIFKTKNNPNYLNGTAGLLEPVYPSPTQILSYPKYFQVGLGAIVFFIILGIFSLAIGIVGLAFYGAYSGVMAVFGPLGPILSRIIGL